MKNTIVKNVKSTKPNPIVRNLLFDILDTLSNVPKKQRDSIRDNLDTNKQDDLCLNLLLQAVELYTWDAYYEQKFKTEAERQVGIAAEKGRKLDWERVRSQNESSGLPTAALT